MNPKTTIILAVLAVAGAIAILISPKKADQPANSPEDESKKQYVLSDPRPPKDSFVKVVFERVGKPALSFERSGARDASGVMEPWRMSAPTAGGAETNTIDGLVHIVLEAEYKRSFKPGPETISVKDAGFDPPLGAIAITDTHGKVLKLEIGGKAPLSDRHYIRLAGQETIYESDRQYSYDIEKDIGEFRGKTPFRIARNNASAVRIEHDGKVYDFVKPAGSGDWVMNSPAKAYAANEKVQGIINNLGNLRLDKYVDDAPASLKPYLLESPYLRLVVTTEEKRPKSTSQPAGSTQPATTEFETVTKTHEILVGGPADTAVTSRFVKLPDQPWVATVASATIDNLLPKDLRDTRVTRVSPESITVIEYTTNGATQRLTRADGRWRGEGDLTDLDNEAVQTLCDAFAHLKAVDFVDDPARVEKAGFDHPKAVIKAWASGAVDPVALEIGNFTGSETKINRFVRLAGQTGATIVANVHAEKLLIEPLSLRSRSIFAYRTEDIRRVEQKLGSRETVIDWVDGAWKITNQEAPIDANGAADIVRDLSILRAKSVVARDEFAKYGLENPLATVKFNVIAAATIDPAAAASAPASAPTASEPITHTISLGRTPAGYFARKDNDAFIFQVDETVYQSLTGELIRRKLFDFDGKAISGIRVESNNGKIDFSLQDGKWSYTPDPSVKPAQTKLNTLATEIAAMAVDRYEAFENAPAEGAEAAINVLISLKAADPVTLRIDQVKRGETPRRALWVEKKRSFLLRPADIDRLIRGLEFYLQEDPPPAADAAAPFPPGGRPGQPPLPRP